MEEEEGLCCLAVNCSPRAAYLPFKFSHEHCCCPRSANFFCHGQARPESPILSVMSLKDIPEPPTLPILSTEAILEYLSPFDVAQMIIPEPLILPVPGTEAIPESSALLVRAIEVTSELSFLPAMTTVAVSEPRGDSRAHRESTGTTSPPQLELVRAPCPRQAGLLPRLQKPQQPPPVPPSASAALSYIAARKGGHEHLIRASDFRNPLLPYHIEYLTPLS
ncbi:unnamed protein product [Leuciscus chuanchicus]